MNLVFEEKISVPHLRAILDQLNPAQSERMGDLVAVRAGIPSDQWRKFKADRLTNNNSVSSLSINPTWPGPTALWRQFIERGAPAAGTRARQYWQSQWCDWPEPDMDWEFDFSMWYNQNPDSLRWDTTSPQVAFAFWFAYGNNLSGYAHQWNQVRLCLGEIGVSLADGPAQVQAAVFIHQ